MPSIGNSDHDIVLLDTPTTVRRPKPPRRKIFLWKRADLQGIKDDLSDLASSIKGETDVNQAWDSVKCKILQTMDSRVPSKITTSRHTNPWMNTQIKRAIRRKQRAHKKGQRNQHQMGPRQIQTTTKGSSVPCKKSQQDLHAGYCQ